MNLAEPFHEREGHIAIDLPGGHVLFTTRRRGDTSDPVATLDLRYWDEPQSSERHVQLLARLAGVAPERIAQSHQVHETRVRVIASEADLVAERSDYDGQATTLRDVAVAVRVADCLPIALVAPEAVAAVHAGWRGLADGVIEEGVRTLHALGASEIRAAIGPGAGVCCYEAGDEVHSAFAHLGVHVRHGANADLKAVARTLLEQWGVTEVHDVGICTICADPGLLWSYRREGLDAGRQVGIAWRS